jgi:hypothetical protein
MENKVSESTEGKYLLSINSLDVNLFSRSVTIKNFVLVPVNRNDTLNNLYAIKISSAVLEKFSFFSYLINKRPDVKKLKIQGSEICIILGSNPNLEKNKKSDKNILAENSDLLIPEVLLINVKLSLIRNSNTPTLILKTGNGKVRIRNFELNRKKDNLKSRFSSDLTDIEVHKIEFHSKDKMYSLYAEKLVSSSTDSLITIGNIQLIPNYSKKDFFKKGPGYISMTNLVCPKIELIGINVKKLLENGVLLSSKLKTSELTLNIYRDSNYPIKKTVKPSAQAVIRDIPLLISIDSIFIKESNLNYEELAEGENSTDKIGLSKIKAVITGINNDSNSYEPESKIKASIEGYFMNKGLLSTNYSFNLNTRKENFTCSGSLSSMPMTAMNPMFKHSKHLIIKKGEIDSAAFNFTAGTSSAQGKMKLIYHDLIVESLPAKNSAGDNKKFKNFMLNNFVVKENNPGKNNETRVVDIEVEHDPYRYFPYYSRQAIMSGLSNSIVGEDKAAIIKKLMK